MGVWKKGLKNYIKDKYGIKWDILRDKCYFLNFLIELIEKWRLMRYNKGRISILNLETMTSTILILWIKQLLILLSKFSRDSTQFFIYFCIQNRYS